MHESLRRLEREIESLRRRYESAFGIPNAMLLHARWTFSGTSLRWHVPVDEFLEPDIDVEITGQVIVVRAERGDPSDVAVGVLPVPDEFEAHQAQIRCRTGILEIRVRRREGPPR